MTFNKKASAAIAALTLTAILLGAILLASSQQSVQAGMLNAQQDFELMTAGVVGADDSLIVLDKNAQKFVIYTLNAANKFNLVTGYNFAPAARP